MVIYPPIIADTVPAFTSTEIKIPFFWNPAVGKNEINYYSLLIKNINSEIIATIASESKEENENIINFQTPSGLTLGDYYKF